MESVDDAQARHRRELRELQGRITSKKKNATKKTRKGVNDECAALEAALKEKHAAELAALAGADGADSVEADTTEDVDADADGLADTLAATTIDAPKVHDATKVHDTTLAKEILAKETLAKETPAKRNRAKERLARRAAEQEAAVAAAQEEASNMVDHGAVERAMMLPLITKAGRREHRIAADGHCLFSSVADQLAQLGKDVGSTPAFPAYRRVRHAAAEYIEAHADDFAPFLMAAGGDGGDGDAPDLATHVALIRDTAEWGGQLELVALANAYGVNVCVLHDGRQETITPTLGAHADTEADKEADTSRPTLWVVYYRHGFGLGEHYNSLREV